jgi:hypothetical protein
VTRASISFSGPATGLASPGPVQGDERGHGQETVLSDLVGDPLPLDLTGDAGLAPGEPSPDVLSGAAPLLPGVSDVLADLGAIDWLAEIPSPAGETPSASFSSAPASFLVEAPLDVASFPDVPIFG